MYAKARNGNLKGFTGLDDPYEPPVNPEITLDTSSMNIDECVTKIMNYLQREGYVAHTNTAVAALELETAEA